MRDSNAPRRGARAAAPIGVDPKVRLVDHADMIAVGVAGYPAHSGSGPVYLPT